MTTRKYLSVDFDLGEWGRRPGIMIADVDGFKVTLLAARFATGPDEENLLSMFTLGSLERFRDLFRDLDKVADAVEPYDYPDGPGGAA